MDCNRIQDRLVDYLTEETRVTERLCVEVHLATCYHCREAMEDVRTVLDAAKDAMRYAGPERSFESAMNEIRTRESLLTAGRMGRVQHSQRWSWGIVASAFPIVIACITPFVLAWPIFPPSAALVEPPEVPVDVRVEGDRTHPDGADPTLPGPFGLLRDLP